MLHPTTFERIKFSAGCFGDKRIHNRHGGMLRATGREKFLRDIVQFFRLLGRWFGIVSVKSDYVYIRRNDPTRKREVLRHSFLFFG
ncbi:hypothetical protein E2C01_043157 [Portunus trituberculatus]|uniref:Uncharacterized protein n=1 Tax=Portunus trituberculatus TaxID=210409 RepID=A0A5B7FWR4_PORTR|nr:hypothetical protein [Portunus trituberculatus]